MLMLIALWVVSVCSALLGWRIGVLRKPAANTAAAICCLVLILGALLARNLDWIPHKLICAPAAYLEYTWFTPPAVLLFALGARQAELRTGRNARLMKLLVVMLAGFSTLRLADQQGWLLGNIGTSPSNIDFQGVVRQKSSFTCGPASCATLLRHLKIDAAATEAQMIPLCKTGMFGSTPLGMAVGLKSIAEPLGWHIQIVKCDGHSFIRRRQPAVVSMREGFAASHAVAVIGFKEDGIQVADPLSGLSWWSISDFNKLFSGEALILLRE